MENKKIFSASEVVSVVSVLKNAIKALEAITSRAAGISSAADAGNVSRDLVDYSRAITMVADTVISQAMENDMASGATEAEAKYNVCKCDSCKKGVDAERSTQTKAVRTNANVN